MSLTLSIVTLDPITREILEDEILSDGKDLAGVESWRCDVYSSAEVISRGAVFLPQLREADLIVDGADLINFKAEVLSLLDEVSLLSRLLTIKLETLEHRLSNIHSAIEIAITLKKGVWLS